MLAARQKVNFASQHQSSPRQSLCHSTESIFPSHGWVIWEIWPAAKITAFHLLFHGTRSCGDDVWGISSALAASWYLTPAKKRLKPPPPSFLQPSHSPSPSSISFWPGPGKQRINFLLPMTTNPSHYSPQHKGLSAQCTASRSLEFNQSSSSASAAFAERSGVQMFTAVQAMFHPLQSSQSLLFLTPLHFQLLASPRNLAWNNLNQDW